MLAALGVLAIGATVAVHVEAVGDVPDALGAAITGELARAIEARARVGVVIDDDRGSCLAGQPCTAAIQSRTSALAVVLVRLIGGPLRVRVVVDHLPGAGAAPRRAESDLGRDGGDVAGVIGPLVAGIIDAAGPEPPALAAEPPPRARSWVPLSLVGVGVASAVVGTVFAVSSRGALDDLSVGAASEAELLELDTRASTHGALGSVLFVVSAGAIAAGIAAWVGE